MSRRGSRQKGALVTRLAHPGLCVVNTHPVANWDGDWPRISRFYPLHHAQLGALARIVRSIGAPAVVCGDFNVDRDSSLFGEFMEETGLAVGSMFRSSSSRRREGSSRTATSAPMPNSAAETAKAAV
jgi:endonuclease/exonuclease/phosphatase (EEP) superfamily protein YafD